MSVRKLLCRSVPVLALLSAGCVKQDVEILSRVGQSLAAKTKASTADLSERLPFRLASVDVSSGGRVRQRLSSDKQLANLAIDVQVRGAEVELKGTVERNEQKRRAVELAESTLGIESVVDSLQVAPPKSEIE